MGYEIILYVHGVPKGQSTWGVADFDRNYIESFYGRKLDTSVQMLVEVKRFGSATYCYYTYLRNNINDNDGRGGSYFALTLRINYYYADIQNMFFLLNAAYDKFIVGSIITVTNGVSKYLIPDFAQADTTLKTLKQEIKRYLMQFSSDSDFIPLSGFQANGQSEVVKKNILECDSKLVEKHVKNYSNVSVSPIYLSVRVQNALQDMNVKIANAKADAQQQIVRVKQNAQHEIQSIKDQTGRTLHEKEERIRKIENEKEEANATIDRLHERLNDAQSVIARYKGINVRQEKLEKENNRVQVEKANKPTSNVGKTLSSPKEGVTDHVDQTDNDICRWSKMEFVGCQTFIRKLLSIKCLVVVILLVCIVIVVLKGCSSRKDTKERSSANEKEQSDPQLQQTEKEMTKAQYLYLVEESEDNSSSLTEYKFARIDISGISDSNSMSINAKTFYIIPLQNDSVNRGKWVSDDFTFLGNVIKPKHSGIYKIFYEVDDTVIVSREINVKE